LHSQTITRLLVVSYTTFSPLPRRSKAVVFFCVSYRRRQLLFSEVERPVLPGLSSRINV